MFKSIALLSGSILLAQFHDCFLNRVPIIDRAQFLLLGQPNQPFRVCTLRRLRIHI